MKKVFLFTIVILSFTSCSSDDDGNSNSLVGHKWIYDQISDYVFSESDLEGIELLDYETLYNECGDSGKFDYFQMKANGVSIDAWYEGDMDCELLTTEGTWSQSGNMIIIEEDYGDGESVTYYYEILEQSNSSLKVKIKEVYVWDDNTFVSYSIVVFRK